MGTGASKEETQSKDGPIEDFSPSSIQSTQKIRQKSEPRIVVSPKDAQQVKSSTDDRDDTRQTSILKRQKVENLKSPLQYIGGVERKIPTLQLIKLYCPTERLTNMNDTSPESCVLVKESLKLL